MRCVILMALVAIVALPALGQQKVQKAKPAVELAKPVHLEIDEGHQKVEVFVGNKPFTTYWWDDRLKRPVLFPIFSANGNYVTRGYPVAPRPNERIDHRNQIGLWFGYGSVNGVDFWNDAKNPSPASKGPYGLVKHKVVKRTADGPVGQLEIETEWQDDKGQVLLVESVVFEFEGTETSRTITRHTTLTARQDVHFEDHRDGLIGLRLCRELEIPYEDGAYLTGEDGKPRKELSTDGSPSGLFVNSESAFDDSVYRKRTEWLLVKGRIGTEPVSVEMMDHAKNLGHPTYWNTRGQGMLAANPLGQAVYSGNLEKVQKRLLRGESLTFKHRIRIQSGIQMMEDDCQRHFVEFSRPPVVEELY